MNDLIHDIQFAWRNALKQRAAALLIVVTLALGIGANIAIFSMTWHVLLAPLPYTDGERLVTLKQNEASSNRLDYGWSNPTFDDFREQNTVYSDLLKYNQWSLTVVGRGEPHHGLVGLVTGHFFELLGVQAALGRVLTADDDRPGAEPVLLLSHQFWLSKFAGDPDVIGSTLEIERSVYRIVGVLPRMPGYPHENDVWMAETNNPYTLGGVGFNPNRRAALIARVVGKLQQDASLEDARRETELIARRLAANYPDDYASDYTVVVTPLKDELTRNSALTILLLMALAALVGLIASANVANLNLVRTMARNQELAIREAVGASPGRIARQLLTESILLALVGGLLGLLIAWPCLHLLALFGARYTPLASEIGINGGVLAFAFGLAVAAGMLGSAAAIFKQRDINKALKEGGDKVTSSANGVHRRNALLLIQFALAFVVLTISTLIMLSLVRLNRQDVGFDLDHVLAVNMTISPDLSEPELISQKMRNFGSAVLTAIRNIPDVRQAAIRAGAPLLEQGTFSPVTPFDIEGRSASADDGGPVAALSMISENYFALMNIPLLQGRAFAVTDDDDAVPVAIINASFAERFFPNGNALGSSIRLRRSDEWRQVVGVVSDIRSTHVDEAEGPAVYFSYWQFSTEMVHLYAKSSADPVLLANTITDLVHELDPRQSVAITPLADVKSTWLAPARLRAVLIALFGVLALAVTLSGVIGVVTYNIRQRVREIGIHMAIGATPANIIGMFIANGLKVYLAGLLLGLALMGVVAPLLAPLLYQTAALNLGVYLLSASVLTLAVLSAIYVPARKAGALSPVAALHFE